MDKFYVGAKVVCVKSERDDEYTKGKVYEVLAIRKDPCKCNGIVIDIGLSCFMMMCLDCGMKDINTNGVYWCNSNDFRLLEPDTELSETRSDEILDLINANE